jgi:hypothetical protein
MSAACCSWGRGDGYGDIHSHEGCRRAAVSDLGPAGSLGSGGMEPQLPWLLGGCASWRHREESF